MIPNYLLYGLLKKEDQNFKKYFNETYKFFNKNEGDFIINLGNKTTNEKLLYATLCRFAQIPTVQQAFLKLKANVTEQPFKNSFWHISEGYLEENDGTAEFAKIVLSISNDYIFHLFDMEKSKRINLIEFAEYNKDVLEQIYKNIDAIPLIELSSYGFAESAILNNIISNLKSLLIGNSITEKLIEYLKNLDDNI